MGVKQLQLSQISAYQQLANYNTHYPIKLVRLIRTVILHVVKISKFPLLFAGVHLAQGLSQTLHSLNQTFLNTSTTCSAHSIPITNKPAAKLQISQACMTLIIIMQVFDINNSQMQSSKPTYYSRFRRVFHEYYFNYPDCRTLNLHESHLSDNTLLGIRIVAFVYLTGIYIWALVDMPTLNTNLIFLTMLGYTATWLYFGLSLQDALIHKTNVISRSLHKIIQIIHEIAVCCQVPITLVFWTLLFRLVLDIPNVTTSEIVLQSNLHSVPLICLIIDLTHNTFTFPLRHVQLLIIFMVIYLIINMSYSLCVKPIYKPIPWTDVASYIIAVGTIVTILFIHFIARVVFRRWKLKKLQQREEIAKNFLNKNRFSQIQDEEAGKENPTFKATADL